MLIIILFATLLAVSLLAAATLGGSEGRWITCLYLLAMIGTHYARQMQPLWAQPQTPVFIVDAALLVGLVVVALNSDRYWPIWIAGFHLLTVAAYFEALAVPGYGYRIYFILESFWSLPKLLVLLIGVLLDWERDRERRRRKRKGSY